MTPDDVPTYLVDLACAALGEATYCDGTSEPVRVALAAILPTHSANLLQQLAAEADTAASAGIEPELNHRLARMLRTRAHREGKL